MNINAVEYIYFTIILNEIRESEHEYSLWLATFICTQSCCHVEDTQPEKS